MSKRIRYPETSQGARPRLPDQATVEPKQLYRVAMGLVYKRRRGPHTTLWSIDMGNEFKAASYSLDEHDTRCGGRLLTTIEADDTYSVICWDCEQTWHAYSVCRDDTSTSHPSDDTIIEAARRDYGKPKPVRQACCGCGAVNRALRTKGGKLLCRRCLNQPPLFVLEPTRSTP